MQLRNLSIDPAWFWSAMDEESNGIGMLAMMQEIKKRVPRLQYGYFNRTREQFFPPGFERAWPIDEI